MRIEYVKGKTPKRTKEQNPAHGKKHKHHYGRRDDLYEDHDHHQLFESLEEHLVFDGWDVSFSSRADGKIVAHVKKDGKLYQQTFNPDDPEWDNHVASKKKQLYKWVTRH